MKRIIALLCFLLALVLLSFGGWAQEGSPESTARIPKWVPEKGYWVVVSNIHDPKQSTLFFYNNDHQQVYKETVTGKRLKPNKRSTLLQMKKILDTALIAWERNQPLSGNEQFFVAARKRK